MARIALCYQKEIVGGTDVYERVLEAVSNNLNSAEAFATIDSSTISLEDWKRIDELFGLNLIADTPDVSEDIIDKIIAREKARADKDYTLSDEIRDDLLTRGIALRDTPDGAVWEYNN